MKLLVLLFLVGCAVAHRGDGYHRTLEAQVNSIIKDSGSIYYGDDGDIQTELGKELQKHLDDILRQLKEAIEQGKGIKEDLVDKAKEIRNKLKDIKQDIGNKAKELLEKIKEKAKDYWQKVLDRLGLKDKEAAVYAAIFESEVEDILNADEDDKEITTELGKKLKEHLDEVLEKIKDAIEHGKVIKEDLITKAKEIQEQLKDLKVDMGNKAKELIEKIKEKSKEFLKKILEKLGLESSPQRSVAHAESKLKDFFKKIKKALLDTIDKEKLIKKIEDFFGKGNELADQLLQMLKDHGDKGKQKLLDWVEKILGEDNDDRETRSLKETWEKIKNYFKDLKIELQEKFAKFGEWVKENVNKGIDAGKSKLENIKGIAREFVDHTKGMSKDVAAEALEFLRPYKEDLGNLWEQVKDSVKEVLNRKE